MQFSTTALEKARHIKGLLMDVDGVLTDGRILFLGSGEEDDSKAFDSKDGLGLRLAQKAGLTLGLLSGRSSTAVVRRARDLGIDHVIQGATDKLPAYENWCRQTGLTDQQVCFIGDDIVDVPVLKRVGLPASVADAHPEALRIALAVATRPGGRGAVRQIVDGLLRAQGKWDEIVTPFLDPGSG